MDNLKVTSDSTNLLEIETKLNILEIENERLKIVNISLKQKITEANLKANKKVSAYKQYLNHFNKKWEILSFDENDYILDRKQLTKVQLINKYEGNQIYWELVIKDVDTFGFILAEVNREIKDFTDIYLSSKLTFVLVDVFKNKKISALDYNKKDRVVVLGTYRSEPSNSYYHPHIEVYSIEVL